MLTTVQRRIGAVAATVVLAAVGIGANGTAASASPVTAKPYAHHYVVETKNMTVHQHNWIRQDTEAKRTKWWFSGYSDYQGTGGYTTYPLSTEITWGRLRLSDSDLTTTDPDGTVRSTGSSWVWVAAELSTNDGRTYPTTVSRGFHLYNHESTGWQHLRTQTGNGDYLELDYQVTNDAAPSQS